MKHILTIGAVCASLASGVVHANANEIIRQYEQSPGDAVTNAEKSELYHLGGGALVGGLFGGPIGAIAGAIIGDAAHGYKTQITEHDNLKAQSVQMQTEKQALQAQLQRLQMDNSALGDQVAALRQINQARHQELLGLVNGLTLSIGFKTKSSEVEPHYHATVQYLARLMKKYAGGQLNVGGFADPRGASEANMALSAQRANSVKSLLIAEGVAEERINVSAFGETKLISDPQDRLAYALERRVEIELMLPSEKSGLASR